MQAELDGFTVGLNHLKLNHEKKETFIETLDMLKLEDVHCTCKGNNTQPSAKKILPTADNTKDIVVYNSCRRTLLAACKRQLRKQPRFDKNMTIGEQPKNLKMSFKQFVEDRFERELKPLLDQFDYNTAEWMNHLTHKKQTEVLPYYEGANIKKSWMTEYSMFCKREKQIIDGKMPKNRAISCPHNSKKFVGGPVVWALEDVFSKYVKGYCGGKNWEHMEDLFAQYYKEGYTYTLQGDGSAFDSTQTTQLKYIDRLIYNYLVEKHKIKHVSDELFLEAMTAVAKKFLLKDNKFKTVGSVWVDGTVFSGDPDTTFGNTLRMSLYIRYSMYLAGYSEDQFKLLCKGDDFVVFVTHIIREVPWDNFKGFNLSKYLIDKNDPYYAIKTCFYQVWHPSDTKYQEDEVGLGMVLKFLNIGGYEDIDFCSTNVIHINKHINDQFKIIRRVDRLTPLSHWCTKALQYSNAEMQQYYRDLAVSMKCWASDMPFFQEYIDALEHHANNIIVTTNKIVPSSKKRMYFDTTGLGPLRGFLDLSHYDKYDRDFIHGYELRQSLKRPTRQETLDFFESKYNLNSLSLIDFGRQLKSTLWVDPYMS